MTEPTATADAQTADVDQDNARTALLALRTEISKARRRAHRASIEAITRAGRPLCAADQAISAARAAHQGTGPHGSPACDPNQHEHVAGYHDPESAPTADLRPLRAALDHIDTDLPHGPA